MAGKITCTQEELDQLKADAIAQGVRQALSGVVSKQVTGYFSTIRFQAVRTGPDNNGVFTYTIAQGTRKAFSYSDGDDLSTVRSGFNLPPNPANPIASLRYTNLSKKSETRDGEKYFIDGVAFYLGKTSDMFIAQLVWDNAYCTLEMGANNIWPLGNLNFFPSVGGLVGTGSTFLVEPALDSEINTLRLIGNGLEDEESYFKFPPESPMIWNPSGKEDSALTFSFGLDNDIVFQVQGRAAGPNIAPFTPPNTFEPFSYVDITVRLIGHSINKLSQNA